MRSDQCYSNVMKSGGCENDEVLKLNKSSAPSDSDEASPPAVRCEDKEMMKRCRVLPSVADKSWQSRFYNSIER